MTAARNRLLSGLLVLAAAAILAIVSAHDQAGAWYDRSRLATVECLVDQHTLIIDHSQFTGDTLDKLWIDGHFYSDKSPVPAVLLAGVYQAWEWLTRHTAADDPAAFCLLMTLASAGLPYVLAVGCIWKLGEVLRLTGPLRLLLTASFGLATVALVYTRYVNNHILLLGVLAPLVLNLARLAEEAPHGTPWWRLPLVGFLAGLGYTIDLGLGPVLLLCVFGLVVWRCRRVVPVATLVFAGLPWLVLHHVLNYAVGGTFKPANANPEYFLPDSPFNAGNMTGTLNHTPSHFVVYAVALLFGKRGFVGHNLPLFLALPGAWHLLRRRIAEWPEVIFAVCCCGGTWLAYGLTSTNYSGQCCSIRWFVPLLAPAYLVLGLLLRHAPRYRSDLLLLSVCGALLMALAWSDGPWTDHMVPLFWPIQAVALVGWLVLSRRRVPEPSAEREVRETARAANARARFFCHTLRAFIEK